MARAPLGIGFIGSGFNARFHIQAFQAVRDCEVRGIWSPNRRTPPAPRELARRLDVGDAKPYQSIAAMVADPAIDAIWLCGPNQARIENVEEIIDVLMRGRGELPGSPAKSRWRGTSPRRSGCWNWCGAPASSTATSRTSSSPRRWSSARTCIWARGARLTGRPFLARAAEEHSGPHRPWFWQGKLQGGGVLERHDVPFRARRPAPADRAGQAASSSVKPIADHRAHRVAQVEPARVRAQAEDEDGPPSTTPRRRRRTSRADDRVRDPRRATPSSARRRHQLELRRRRPAALGRAAGARVLDELEHPRRRAQALLLPRGAGEGRRGPGGEAERRDGPDARRGQRGDGVRV